MNKPKIVKCDSRFIREVMALANTMTVRELDYMAAVGLRRELGETYSHDTIRRMEDIFWTVAAGKRVAA